METYPQDLLVGVHPLVFAVDAILPSDGGGQSRANSPSIHQKRSIFDKFLDAVAASLIDADVFVDNSTNSSSAMDFHNHNMHHHSEQHSLINDNSSNKVRRNVSIFRPDEDESSDDEDFEFFGATATSGGVAGSTNTSQSRKKNTSSLSAGFYTGFGRRSLMGSSSNNATNTAMTSGGAGGGSTHYSPALDDSAVGKRASYAKALTHGQGFFTRARIEAVGVNHGFPPSKDPEGTNNLAFALPLFLKERDPLKLKRLFQTHPISGILPAGWLEKHVHALPSAILVVCTVTSSQREQQKQDKRLLETIEHLKLNLVPKRQCTIYVIGLMHDDVTMSQSETWSLSITNHMLGDDDMSPSVADPPFRVTLLRESEDLQASDTGMPTSPALRRLHQMVRDASMMYYLSQARRTKEKLLKLMEGHQQQQRSKQRGGASSASSASQFQEVAPYYQLLPLVIRYCFKLAIFYEFQWKHEKSLRFMVEAYRHTMEYYQYLLDVSLEAASATSSDGAATQNHASSNHHQQQSMLTAVDSGGDSFEVTINDNNSSHGGSKFWNSILSPLPPSDMIHQCRAVAEWLNLKLLSAGFASHTEGGLLAAAHQWRQHCRMFATRQQQLSSSSSPSTSAVSVLTLPPLLPDWFEWSYIARQRLVMSQLVERHPPKALGDLGNDYDEVLLRCSPWRTYESAVEATLRLALAIDKEQAKVASAATARTNSDDNEDNGDVFDETPENNRRARYVGGLGAEGLAPELRELVEINHRGHALDLVLRSISLYERELEKEKRGFYAEDSFVERSSSRAGARLYYLAGGILLGMKRHQEAAGHLQRASKFSKGWRGLELAVRRMLIECYEKHMPSSSSEASEESNEAIASMILDSYFNAQMSTVDLRRALGHFASISGGTSLKWHHETIDEENSRLPFSFAVSFPGTTHATAGDCVKASVLITSNLDYAVHVNSVTLLSLAGKLSIPSMDLLSATNASEGSDGGIIIQSKTSIIISTEIDLPKDTSIIAVDDSGNGGENQGVAGKGSFAKSARPRTAGVTAAGGARLVSEEEISPANRVGQGWSLRCLGGKPLRCDGLKVVFFPVQAEKASGSPEAVTLIELSIQKKKSKTAANIKRTPFEEENYVASAWSRPMNLPLCRGPRSLRVLGPMPELVIKDVTADATGGKAIEGTVNRVLFKVTAGQKEHCSNLKFRISCFSVLVTPEGSTKRLVSEKEVESEPGSSANMKNPTFRTPTLVTPAESTKGAETDCGYNLPDGWVVAGDGLSFTGLTWPLLQDGDSTFVELDLFRPPPKLQNPTTHGEENLGDFCICKTDFYVNVSYQQQRPHAQKPKRGNVRATRRRRPLKQSAFKANQDESFGGEPSDPSCEEHDQKSEEKSQEESLFDEVSLEFSGSVVWEKPLSAIFSSGARVSFPSGNRHHSNEFTPEDAQVSSGEFCVAEGSSISKRCTVQTDSAVSGLKTEIYGIRFDDCSAVDPQNLVTLSLQGGQVGDNGLLYNPSSSDPCRVMSSDSKLTVAYTVKPTLPPSIDDTGTKSSLGIISVDWKPSSLPLPDDARKASTFLGKIHSHGPLRLDCPSTIRFQGPIVHIERSPFDASLMSLPANPKVGIPFNLTYTLANKTASSQVARVEVFDPCGGENGPVSKNLLFTGLLGGEITLGPLEAQTITFTVLATRAGKTRLPSLHLSSERFKSWIIKEATRNEIYIFP